MNRKYVCNYIPGLTSQIEEGPLLGVESSEREASKDDTGAQEGCWYDAVRCVCACA